MATVGKTRLKSSEESAMRTEKGEEVLLSRKENGLHKRLLVKVQGGFGPGVKGKVITLTIIVRCRKGYLESQRENVGRGNTGGQWKMSKYKGTRGTGGSSHSPVKPSLIQGLRGKDLISCIRVTLQGGAR